MTGLTVDRVRIHHGKDKVLRNREVEDEATAAVRLMGGAEPPVRQRLQASGGDALAAFVAWVHQQQGYQRVSLGTTPKGGVS